MAGELEIAFRWVHFFAGITWIGLLWFFNFVNVPFQKEIPGDVKSAVNPKLLGRALWWFRHTAWLTVLMGLLLIWRLYPPDGAMYAADGTTLSDGFKTIATGGLLGILMMLNVWFVIWPNQTRLLGAMATGGTVDPNWGKRALNASRANTVMSFPMLFFMAGASHYPLGWTNIAIVLVALGALAWFMIWWVQMRPKPTATGGPAGSPAK